jgi:hypothetical protein
MCIAAYDDENDGDDIHRLSVKYRIAKVSIQRYVTCLAISNDTNDLSSNFPFYLHEIDISPEGENRITFLPLFPLLSPKGRKISQRASH